MLINMKQQIREATVKEAFDTFITVKENENLSPNTNIPLNHRQNPISSGNGHDSVCGE